MLVKKAASDITQYSADNTKRASIHTVNHIYQKMDCTSYW